MTASLFSTAEKPRLGLYITVASGLTNMVLDALFVAVLGDGIEGAAWATAISQCVGGFIPLVYFARRNSSRLKLGKTRWNGRDFAKVCGNGSSELMSNVAMSLVNMLYNVQLLKYVGQDGIAAYGVLMYVSLVFLAIFIGFSMGSAPVVSYHYGAENKKELHSLLRKSLAVITVSSVLMFIAAEFLAGPLSRIFVGYDADLFNLTKRAFFVYSFSFLLAGFNIYCSSFFTALNNGAISALISFLRTLIFEVGSVLLLPLLFRVDGIWMSVDVAELLALIVSVIFLVRKRKQYGY